MKNLILSLILILFTHSGFANTGQNGGSIEFGVNFGGDTIAYNPGGDDYKAGGGALLLVGYYWPDELLENTSYQVSTGVRYQGAKIGKGENMGWITKVAMSHALMDYDLINNGSLRNYDVSVGVGLQIDLFSYTKNEFGVKTNINDSISPYIFAEWEIAPLVSFTASYLITEFTDENNVVYNGNQFGLGLRMAGLNFIP